MKSLKNIKELSGIKYLINAICRLPCFVKGGACDAATSWVAFYCTYVEMLS